MRIMQKLGMTYEGHLRENVWVKEQLVGHDHLRDPGAGWQRMIDQRARQILFKTYWSSAGWRPHPSTSPADFEYARQAGAMFDPVVCSHDEIIRWLVEVMSKVDRRRVAHAFLASLSTRRVELRSALGSYALAHEAARTTFQLAGACPICGCRTPGRVRSI